MHQLKKRLNYKTRLIGKLKETVIIVDCRFKAKRLGLCCPIASWLPVKDLSKQQELADRRNDEPPLNFRSSDDEVIEKRDTEVRE